MSRSARRRQYEVIRARARLDIGRDREAGAQLGRQELVFMLRVFGRLLVTVSATRSEGRRPKSLRGGNRGEFAPAVVSVYGDLAPI
jgi:hypothetical protein